MKKCKSRSQITKLRRLTKTTLILSVMFLLASACNQKTDKTLYHTPLLVGEQKILVKVAKMPNEQKKGLSGQRKLSNEQGMLFDFSNLFSNPSPQKERVTFWMKDMLFDLDLIWIRQNKIIGITPNVPAPQKNTPDSELILYISPDTVDKVLEVNAGWSEKNNIRVGEEVQLIK